jgi:hypothetical protein
MDRLVLAALFVYFLMFVFLMICGLVDFIILCSLRLFMLIMTFETILFMFNMDYDYIVIAVI